MKFNQLPGLAPRQAKRRHGRGISAGLGKTAGRGTKGQKSRSGGGVRPHFEGGQTPLVRRLPKLAGFRSRRPPSRTVYSGQLDEIKTNSKVIDNYVLAQAGLVPDAYSSVKLIKKGGVLKALKDDQPHNVRLQGISPAALKALVGAGGSFEKVARPQRPASKKKAGRSQQRQQRRDKRASASKPKAVE